LLSPDAGAEKKVRSVAKKISSPNQSIDVLCASKTRDTRTGEITATEIHGDVKGKDIIILDDICDGGRTFIELAKVLRALNSGNIYLYITHGIFSKGLEVLEESFKHIYCYHTMLQPNQIKNSFLTIVKNSGE
jgi:ribose-phosphate pyrophosphokinase